MIRIAVLLAVATGCVADVDPPWQLDHDRIIAVRATPPGILADERAELDALIGVDGAAPYEAPPELATVISPARLQGAIGVDGGRWYLTAPDEAELAAVRAELMLAADAPVPVQVGLSYAGQELLAIKTVWLGESRSNPVLDSAMIDGVAAGAVQEIVVPPETDVPLVVDATDEDGVNWLTSCGEMRDFDLPTAYVRVDPDDEEREGELAVVLRTPLGGVAWRVWPIRVDE